MDYLSPQEDRETVGLCPSCRKKSCYRWKPEYFSVWYRVCDGCGYVDKETRWRYDTMGIINKKKAERNFKAAFKKAQERVAKKQQLQREHDDLHDEDSEEHYFKKHDTYFGGEL